MPARFLPYIADIIFTAMTMAVLFISDALAGTSISVPIWDKTDLIRICFGGATAGAWLYIALFQRRETSDTGQSYARKLAGKFISAAVTGVVFTPMLMKWMHIPLDPDYVLGISALVACGGVGVIHRLIPALSDLVMARLPKVPETKPEEDEATNHQA